MESSRGKSSMSRIQLKKVGSSGKLNAKKTSIECHSRKYKAITEETNRRIDESQRRYASAYQRASTFLAM